MVQAYRLLAHEMYKLGWDYPSTSASPRRARVRMAA